MAEADRASWARHASEQLARAGYRASSARSAVVEALAAQSCCLTAQEIFDSVRASGRRVGIASVYRALDLLTELNLVRRVEIGDASSYEIAPPGGEHHHHAVCDRCGKVSPFEDPGLEAAIDRLGRRLRYDVGVHEVVIRGDCPDCRRAA